MSTFNSAVWVQFWDLENYGNGQDSSSTTPVTTGRYVKYEGNLEISNLRIYAWPNDPSINVNDRFSSLTLALNAILEVFQFIDFHGESYIFSPGSNVPNLSAIKRGSIPGMNWNNCISSFKLYANPADVWVKFYDKDGYDTGGNHGTFTQSDSNLEDSFWPGTDNCMNNDISSFQLGPAAYLRIASDKDYHGDTAVFGPGTLESKLKDVQRDKNSSWENCISSFELCAHDPMT